MCIFVINVFGFKFVAAMLFFAMILTVFISV